MARFPLRPVERRRAFEEILYQLERAIVAGRFHAGDRLPSEREMAASFEVSRTSVREALRVLEALGIVRVRRGADNGATLLDQPEDAFTQLLRFHLALQHIEVEDLIEFRVLIESWAAGVLARTRTLHALAELEKLIVEMEVDGLDQVAFHQLDAAFHLALVRGSSNELAALILNGSRTAIQRAMLDAILRAKDWPSLRRRLSQEHRRIYRALEKGDDQQASALVAQHIRKFYKTHLGGSSSVSSRSAPQGSGRRHPSLALRLKATELAAADLPRRR